MTMISSYFLMLFMNNRKQVSEIGPKCVLEAFSDSALVSDNAGPNLSEVREREKIM